MNTPVVPIALSCCLLAACSPDHFRTYAYRGVSLDVTRLTLEPEGPLARECPRHVEQCYVRQTDFRGRPHVDHLGPLAESPTGAQRRTYFNMFFVAADRSLVHRSKIQLILSGPFGHVYARSTYYYAPQYAGQPNGFEVAGYLADAPFEAARIDGSGPSGARLDAISLVRVFHHPPEFLVLSADYAPTGAIRAFHVNGTMDGKWTNLPEASTQAGVELGRTSFGDRSPHRETFGFPVSFPIAEYLAGPRRVWRATAHAEYLTTVTLHYEFNRSAAQQLFRGEALQESRTLRFSVSPEDRLLQPVDEQRGFGGAATPLR